MTELIFEGDWQPNEIEQAIAQLKKSLSMGDSGLDELTPVSIDSDWLTKRQKKLHQLLQQAIAAAESDEDSDPPSWDAYKPLSKSFRPRFKRQPDGDLLYLNRNNRWAKWDGSVPEIPQLPVSDFKFPVVDGEFGRGVYLPVAQPTGSLRLRVHLNLPPGSLISDDQFYEIEDDLAGNTELLLDGQNVRAIARTKNDQIDLLCIRNASDIDVLGIVGGSGAPPTGAYEFRIVELSQGEEALTLDIEMADRSTLEKSATKDRRTTFSSTTHLNGTKLIPVHRPTLNRFLVKQAITRCEADGVPFDRVQVCLVQGVPDFLDPSVYAFCLPQDGRVCLVPHDPHEAIADLCKRLSMRLRAAVKAGAIAGDEALQILQKASQLSPDWWLEVLIKRYVGAILAAQADNIMQSDRPSVWAIYMQLLAGRGVAYWGNRRTIAECIAEDYRCAYDPAGLPNLVTLEWDLQVPALARAGQQAVVQVISAAPASNSSPSS